METCNLTNKIAAEAATGFLGYPRHNDPNTWDSLYESFLAAIEKATEPLNKALNAIANKSDLLFPAQLRAIASNALQSRAAHASETWWYEITSDSDWIIGSGNRGFALVNDESQAQIIVDRHNRAAHARECICEEGFGMNLSCPVHGAAHASEVLPEGVVRDKATGTVNIPSGAAPLELQQEADSIQAAIHAAKPYDAKVEDILKRLRYIAESPSKEHGGFHEQAIQTAKDAIEFIEQVMTQKKK